MKDLNMLATILKSNRATVATLAIIKTFAKVRADAPKTVNCKSSGMNI